MSDDNGKESRILQLGRVPKDKTSDFATKGDIARLVEAEASKIHAFYLNQLPPFVARMIQDALVSYGLVVVPVAPPETDVTLADSTGVPCGNEPSAEMGVVADSPEVA